MLVIARNTKTKALFSLQADSEGVPYLWLDGLLWVRAVDRRGDAFLDRRYTPAEFYERFEIVGQLIHLCDR